MKPTFEELKNKARRRELYFSPQDDDTLLFTESELNELIQKKVNESNEFIIDIAKLLKMDTDGIGYDGLQFSIDDYQEGIDKLINARVKELLLSDYLISVEDQKPNCWETGDWDGKRSDIILCIDKDKNYQLAHCYEGFLDGSNFFEWYDKDDFGLRVEITHWTNLT